MTDLAEVAAKFVDLTATASGTLRGFCPFCDPSLPVFNVNPAKGLWWCFGCQRGGDLTEFIRLLREE